MLRHFAMTRKSKDDGLKKDKIWLMSTFTPFDKGDSGTNLQRSRASEERKLWNIGGIFAPDSWKNYVVELMIDWKFSFVRWIKTRVRKERYH